MPLSYRIQSMSLLLEPALQGGSSRDQKSILLQSYKSRSSRVNEDGKSL